MTRLRELLQWADMQMKAGHSRQAMCDLLLTQRPDMPMEEFMRLSMKEMDAHNNELQVWSDAERQLFNVMVQRNLSGKEAEAQGDAEHAIRLYEANVADAFIGSYPYERLRVIYSKRKEYSKALNACAAFIKVSRDPTKTARYQEHATKLKAKVENA